MTPEPAEIIAAAIDRLAAATQENAEAMKEWIELNRAIRSNDRLLTSLYAEHTELLIAKARNELEHSDLTLSVERLIADRLAAKQEDPQ